jgi:1,4-dihydroxy-2-naphthoate polyprenyltransferase
MNLKTWFLETRPQFLILSVILAFLGTVIAWNTTDNFNLWFALLAGLGLVLAHASVNIINDWFDFRSGIDQNTPRTPFSGGSGILPAQKMLPHQVLWFGLISFCLIFLVGVYFVFKSGWLLLPLLIIAGVCIISYSPLILKTRYPEWAAGLGLGMLPILGVFFVQTSEYTIPALIASIPSGLLVYNLLLLNEFPDIEADRNAGRKTLPITEGRRKASIVYSVVTIFVYVWIILAVTLRQMPVFSLIGLLTIPLAVKASKGALNSADFSKLVPAMADNVKVVLLTQLLLGIGYVLDKVI